MTKMSYLVLALGGIIAVGAGVHLFQKENTPEVVKDETVSDRSSDSIDEAVPSEKKTDSSEKKQGATTTTDSDSKEAPGGENETEGDATQQSDEEAEEEDDEISVTKSGEKIAVKFKGGKIITENEVNKIMESVPPQLVSRISYQDLKFFSILNEVYKEVVLSLAKKEGFDKLGKVTRAVAKKRLSEAVALYLDEQANKLMDEKGALQEHYDKLWVEVAKLNQKEITAKIILVSDPQISDTVKNTAKSMEDLEKLVSIHKDAIKIMDFGKRPEGMYPKEVIDPIKKAGKGKIVGPFSVNSDNVFFYVSDISNIVKQKFDKKFANEYRYIAKRDFLSRVLISLCKRREVTVYALDKTVVQVEDLFKTKEAKEVGKKPASNKKIDFSKITDDFVLAKFGNKKIIVKDIKEFFKVDSISGEVFSAMAARFNLSVEDVVLFATKIVLEDRIVEDEVLDTHYIDKCKDKLKEVERIEIMGQYTLSKYKPSVQEVKLVYKQQIDSIPEEDKNDKEISTKMIMFKTRQDAEKELSAFNNGDKKFNDAFKEALQSHGGIDLGYVKRQGVDPEIWAVLKRGATATCCNEVVELDGRQFGVQGKIFAIVYVGDRRPVTLPSLDNPADKKQFEMIAMQQKAMNDIVSKLGLYVISINGVLFSEFMAANEMLVRRMIQMIVAAPLVSRSMMAGRGAASAMHSLKGAPNF